ncbi:MAG TPA: rhodanese-like domain-containing protein [Streptosporangiaceae bacterium]|nr:rhodanese-like domain-containing protein [Streptosporangiaceae bacterium]
MVAHTTRSVDDLVYRARSRLGRLNPVEAQAAIGAGAILVDTRPQAQRQTEGAVPGALLVERNVLEWRFDPRSAARLPEAVGYDAHVIVMCSQGYASSLAAASLQDLGLRNATDLAGGFVAWANAGLPVGPGCCRRAGSSLRGGSRRGSQQSPVRQE